MSVKIRGMKKLLDDLDKSLGKEAIQHITDKALTEGAKVFVKELKAQLATFRDTGATIDEVTITGPYTEKGVRSIKIHWKGPKGRYRVIHLNEWGTIQNPSPRGKGKIALALRNAEKEYARVVRKAIREGLR